MAEDKDSQDQQNLEDQGSQDKQTEGRKEPSVDEKIRLAVKDIEDRVKAEIAGLNRRNTELETELESERKARMTEKERAEYERTQKEEALEKKDREIAARELALERTTIAVELGIPKALVDRLRGSNRDELLADAKALMESFGTAVQDGVNKKLVDSGGKPPSGDEGKSTSPYSMEQLADPEAREKIFREIEKMPPGKEKDKKLSEIMAATMSGG